MTAAGATRTDVLVLGAGPAGCAAAISARRAGLSVAVLEARTRPAREPGETMHPGIEPLFRQLGVLEQVVAASGARHAGVWAGDGAALAFGAYGSDAQGPWLGLQVDRSRLGSILRAAATREHAEVLAGVRAEALLTEGGRVLGVRAGGRSFEARWTFDATGRAAWLARRLQLRTDLLSPPLSVRFGWHAEPAAAQPCFGFVPDGWRWHAGVGEGRTAWVQLEIARAGNSRAGLDMTWRLRPDSAGPGYFLLGDAALLLDPASSHGVLRALMSGLLAAHLAAGIERDAALEHEALDAYRGWLREQADGESRRLSQCYLRSAAGPRFAMGLGGGAAFEPER